MTVANTSKAISNKSEPLPGTSPEDVEPTGAPPPLPELPSPRKKPKSHSDFDFTDSRNPSRTTFEILIALFLWYEHFALS
jgi:hypothetical protein